MKKAIALMAMASIVGAANAIIVQPGIAPGSAASIVRGPAIWADAGVMNLSAGGTHWWKISLDQGEVFSVMTTPLQPINVAPDTVMSLWDNNLGFITRNDDSPGNSLGSSVRHEALYSGDYYVAVVGFQGGDQTNISYYSTSTSTEVGNYVLTASIVPEPGTFAALGLGAVALLRRRKK